jgi:hypothetical protein
MIRIESNEGPVDGSSRHADEWIGPLRDSSPYSCPPAPEWRPRAAADGGYSISFPFGKETEDTNAVPCCVTICDEDWHLLVKHHCLYDPVAPWTVVARLREAAGIAALE